MSDPIPKQKIRIIHLLPNLVTLAAIGAGLTAIRFGFQGNFELGVELIVLACVLDAVDGRLARLLKCSSAVGGELDSLADFVNFGVAPVLIIYSWGVAEYQSAGWMAVLAYAFCAVLRLARFNVSSRLDTAPKEDRFIGVPSPAGAILVMFPMYIAFLFPALPLLPPQMITAYMVLVGFLMICRLPTYAFKNVSVERTNANFLLLGAILMATALLMYIWATLAAITLIYCASLVWAFGSYCQSPKTKG